MFSVIYRASDIQKLMRNAGIYIYDTKISSDLLQSSKNREQKSDANQAFVICYAQCMLIWSPKICSRMLKL